MTIASCRGIRSSSSTRRRTAGPFWYAPSTSIPLFPSPAGDLHGQGCLLALRNPGRSPDPVFGTKARAAALRSDQEGSARLDRDPGHLPQLPRSIPGEEAVVVPRGGVRQDLGDGKVGGDEDRAPRTHQPARRQAV